MALGRDRVLPTARSGLLSSFRLRYRTPLGSAYDLFPATLPHLYCLFRSSPATQGGSTPSQGRTFTRLLTVWTTTLRA